MSKMFRVNQRSLAGLQTFLLLQMHIRRKMLWLMKFQCVCIPMGTFLPLVTMIWDLVQYWMHIKMSLHKTKVSSHIRTLTLHGSTKMYQNLPMQMTWTQTKLWEVGSVPRDHRECQNRWRKLVVQLRLQQQLNADWSSHQMYLGRLIPRKNWTQKLLKI